MALRDVIGQEKAVCMLLGAIRRGRLASSYLFTGESGIGKRFAALNLAKAINCPGGIDDRGTEGHEAEAGCSSSADNHRLDGDSCDICRSCRKIDSGNHPDVRVLTSEKGEIRVEEIREIETILSFRPYEGCRKVVIIDDADLMNPSASNAFLKTLEEPPGESHLILISPSPDRLPETIRSRCSRVHFTPLSQGDCARVIEKVLSRRSHGAGKEKGPIRPPESQAQALAGLVMGRPGLALSSDLIAERERFLNLLRNMLADGGDTWSDRDEMERWIDHALLFLRDLAVFSIDRELAHVFNADMGDVLDDMSKRVNTTGIIELYRRLSLLKRDTVFNLNKAITWNYTASMVQEIFGGSSA
jgi:DNA polymerase-3 subunit delta'